MIIIRRLVVVVLLCLYCGFVISTSSSSSTSNSIDGSSTTGGLPRSTQTSPYSKTKRQNSIPRSSRSTIRRRSIVQYSTSSSSSDAGTENNNCDGVVDYFNAVDYQPWNPSPLIDENGFLIGYYKRIPGEWEKDITFLRHNSNNNYNAQQQQHQSIHKQPYCQIRQVPGDGNCLFHSISLCLYYAVNGTHWDITGTLSSTSTTNNNIKHAYEDLYYHSQQLRQAAVECLSCGNNNSNNNNNNNNRNHYHRLYLQGREFLQTSELVQAASQQYGMTPSEYCEAMKQESVWGGGPEIVALSNVLKRPIHVYELATSNNNNRDDNDNNIQLLTNSNRNQQSSTSFVLRRMACFGSPRFDRNTALHILSADSRFPDIQPGQQLASGNHFLAIFPLRDDQTIYTDPKIAYKQQKENKRKHRVRGGFAMYRNRFWWNNNKLNSQQEIIDHQTIKDDIHKDSNKQDRSNYEGMTTSIDGSSSIRTTSRSSSSITNELSSNSNTSFNNINKENNKWIKWCTDIVKIVFATNHEDSNDEDKS